ncbi:hypothetical protein RSAG8_02809, partial [Rhizoctonia solani AG-8 WAC10335]
MDAGANGNTNAGANEHMDAGGNESIRMQVQTKIRIEVRKSACVWEEHKQSLSGCAERDRLPVALHELWRRDEQALLT